LAIAQYERYQNILTCLFFIKVKSGVK